MKEGSAGPSLSVRRGVVGRCQVRPGDDDGIVGELEGALVLVADDAHAFFGERVELFGGRAAIEADVGVDAGGFVFGGVFWMLEPDRDGEEGWVSEDIGGGLRWCGNCEEENQDAEHGIIVAMICE